MSIEEQRRRNEVVTRIRRLRSEQEQNGGSSVKTDEELTDLIAEADSHDWFYW